MEADTTLQHESQFLHGVVLALGFIVSVVWIQMVATEVVVILEFLGSLAEIDRSILGMTVLAWGMTVLTVISSETRLTTVLSGLHSDQTAG